MHPIGQSLSFDDFREYQDRGTEHFHAPFHVEGAPKVYEDKDSKDTEFIDQYITPSLPTQSKCSELKYNHIISLKHAEKRKV